jgi:hypothetical protein
MFPIMKRMTKVIESHKLEKISKNLFLSADLGQTGFQDEMCIYVIQSSLCTKRIYHANVVALCVDNYKEEK